MNRLLIIEDDHNTLNGLQELLSCEGYLVRGVSNGAMAIRVIEREPIDMVLCDYCLSEMDGGQVCRSIKQLQPNLIIFLITAYSHTDIVNLVKEGVIERVVKKPIILDELYASLTKIC